MATSNESEAIWSTLPGFLLLVLSPFIAVIAIAGLAMVLIFGYEVVSGTRMLTDIEKAAWIGKCVKENTGQFVAVGGEQSYCESEVPRFIKATEQVDLRTGDIVLKSR